MENNTTPVSGQNSSTSSSFNFANWEILAHSLQNTKSKEPIATPIVPQIGQIQSRNTNNINENGKRIISNSSNITTIDDNTKRQKTNETARNIQLPIVLGGYLIIARLGVVVHNRELFHNAKYIWPVGYTSLRLFKTKSEVCFFKCEILDSVYQPVFRITPLCEPLEMISSHNIDECWNVLRVKKNIDALCSGADFFGLSHPNVYNFIAKLPNANQCKWFSKKLLPPVVENYDPIISSFLPSDKDILNYLASSITDAALFLYSFLICKEMLLKIFPSTGLSKELYLVLIKAASVIGVPGFLQIFESIHYSKGFSPTIHRSLFELAWRRLDLFDAYQFQRISLWKDTCTYHSEVESRSQTIQTSPRAPPTTQPVTENNGQKKSSHMVLISQAISEKLGILVPPTQIKHLDSLISFQIDDKLINLLTQTNERYKDIDKNEKPLQIQLQCSPNSIVSGKQQCLVSVNGVAIQDSRDPVNINSFITKGRNLVRVCCSDLSPAYILRVQLMRCFTSHELLQRIQKNNSLSISKETTKSRIESIFQSPEIEIQQVSMKLSLRDPITKMKYPGRSIHCKHLQCFDLLSFIQFSLRMPKHKWMCPVCTHPLPLTSLYIDPYFDEVLLLTNKDTADIEVMKDGSWKSIQISKIVNTVDLTDDGDTLAVPTPLTPSSTEGNWMIPCLNEIFSLVRKPVKETEQTLEEIQNTTEEKSEIHIDLNCDDEPQSIESIEFNEASQPLDLNIDPND